MNKIMALIAVLVLCAPAFAVNVVATSVTAASEDMVISSNDYAYPVLDKQVEIRKAHIAWMAAIKKVSMDAVVDYVSEKSNGSGSGKLEQLRTELQQQETNMQTLTTHLAINNALAEMVGTVSGFRQETVSQMGKHNGKYVVLAANIVVALDEHKDELDALEDNYWQVREENSLDIFDVQARRAQAVIDTLEAYEYDITEAQAQLDQIKAERTGLQTALQERSHLKIAAAYVKIGALSAQLVNTVKELQAEIPSSVTIPHWIDVGDRALHRTSTVITELESMGFNVTELKTIQADAESDWQDAKDAYEADDINAAIDALKRLKNDLLDMKEAYLRLIASGKLPDSYETALQATSDALAEAANGMA